MVRITITILLALALGGCFQQDMSDLEAYVKEVKARPAGGISPPPEPAEVETFLYVAADRRDPFEPQTALEERSETVVESGLSPDFNRSKEELELYPLDSLRMVGTLEQDGGAWGLVQTRDGTIHRVTKGNYMGQNHGRIVNIAEDEIKLVELIQIGSGYQEQEAALGLGDTGN